MHGSHALGQVSILHCSTCLCRYAYARSRQQKLYDKAWSCSVRPLAWASTSRRMWWLWAPQVSAQSVAQRRNVFQDVNEFS